MKATLTKAVILMMTFVGLVACNSDEEKFDEHPLEKTSWVYQSAEDDGQVTINFDSDTEGTMRAVTTMEPEDEGLEAITMEVCYKFNYALAGTVVYVVCHDAVVTINGESEQAECDSQSIQFLYDWKAKTLTLDADEEDGGQQLLKKVAYSPIKWPEIIHTGTAQPPYNTSFDPAVFDNFKWEAKKQTYNPGKLPVIESAFIIINNGRPIGVLAKSNLFITVPEIFQADHYTYKDGVLEITTEIYTIRIDNIFEMEDGKFSGQIHVIHEGKEIMTIDDATGSI